MIEILSDSLEKPLNRAGRKTFTFKSLSGEPSFPTGAQAISLFNSPIWKEAKSGVAGVPVTAVGKAVWLCFINKRSAVDRSVIEATGGDSSRRISVVKGGSFKRYSINRYRICPHSEVDYERLVQAILNDFGTISGVIHLWSYHRPKVANEFKARDSQSCRTISALGLAKALGGAGNRTPIIVNFITRGLIKDRNQEICPANHALVGAVGVIQSEYANLITRTIDIGEGIFDLRTERTLHQVLNGDRHHLKLVLKNGSCWLPDFENDDPQIIENLVPFRQIKDGGVYVITGGLGDLARSIAKDWSARARDLTFVLITRTNFPAKEDWSSLLKAAGTDPETMARIEDLVEIEVNGSRIRILPTDLSEPGSIDAIFKGIHKQHGAIDGVIHASEVLTSSTIASKDAIEEVFATKALPAQRIYEFFSSPNHKTDFVALFSSAAVDLAAPGQIPEAAANAWLDGLAELAWSRGLPFVSVAWPSWREVGNEERSINFLSREQGTRAFYDIVTRMDTPRSVVSVLPFAQLYHSSLKDRQPTSHRNPETLKSFEAPVEQMVSIWKRALKNSEITADDNYFALGGDSMIAVQILGVIRDTFEQAIPMSQLIKAPTPRKLVQLLGLEVADADSFDSLAKLPGNIIPLRIDEKDSESPIFCVHGGDGGVMFYQPFATQVRKGHSIYGVESKMLYDETWRMKDIETMAREYIADIKKVRPNGPYVFAGYSFGALVALHMAQLAEAAGDQVEGVILFEMFNPQSLRPYSVFERLRVIWEQRSELEFKPRVASSLKRCGELVRLRCIQLRWRHHYKTGRLDGEYVRHLKTRYWNELLIPNFRPTSYEGRALIILTEDPGDKFDFGPLHGWKNVLTGRLTHRFVTGNHHEIFSNPHLEGLVKHTNTFLEGITQRSPQGAQEKTSQKRLMTKQAGE